MQWMLMPFRRYADFDGRSRRREFWMFVLFNWLLGVAFSATIGIVMLILYVADVSEEMMVTTCLVLVIPYILYSLYALIPNLAVAVRRLHDVDKSGWFILIGLIPFVGAILLLVFYATEGTSGPNRFGPDPLADGSAQIFA